MKSQALFKEYIWLVNTIYRAQKITFDAINNKWIDTEMSGGIEMARSTFNRHKDAIEDIFGIFIECDRTNGYKYYIGNVNVLEEESVQNWMLSTLAVNNIISDSLSIHDRILLESIPSNGDYLHQVIDAMKNSVLISINYQRYSASEPKLLTIEPYCIKLFRQRWYVLGHFKNGNFGVFSFDRIRELELTNERFEVCKDFNAEQFFSECFGIVQGDGTLCNRIVLRAFGTKYFYLRDLPLHHTQKEIYTCDKYVDFEYQLRPTMDFLAHILSQGCDVKVMEPQWLADEIHQMHQNAIKLYEE